MVLKLGNFLADSLACFQAPSIRFFYLHFPPIIFSDVHFLERVLLTLSEMVVPQLVHGKIGTSSITVNGGPCLYLLFNDGHYGAPDLSKTEYEDFC